MACARRFSFEGDDAAYIRFLEDRVHELESTLQTSISREAQVQRMDLPQSHSAKSQVNNICEGTSDCRTQSVRGSENAVPGCLGDGTRLANARQAEGQDTQPSDDARGATFEIIEFNPFRDPKLHLNKGKPEARSQTAKKQRQLLSQFTRFIRDLPKSEVWLEWVSVSDSERQRIIHHLIQGFAPTGLKASPPGILSTELAILAEYGNSMAKSSTTPRQFTCFRELIFCSLCAVALRSVENKEEVYETMRKVFGSDAGTKTFEALIRGAKWINHAICLLSRTGWALQSWDIILLAARPVSFYTRFRDFSIQPEHLIQSLVAHGLSCPEDTHTVPLAIPLIIGRIFQNSTPLEEICQCLGYEFSDVESLHVRFDSVFQSPDSIKRRKRSKQTQASKRHHRGDPMIPDRQSTPRASLPEGNCPILFKDIPTLPDSVPGRESSLVPQAGEPRQQEDDLGTTDIWFSTDPNTQFSEPAMQGADLGTTDVWFSTYPNPLLGEPAVQGADLGTTDVWFSTYPNPQLGEPAAQADLDSNPFELK